MKPKARMGRPETGRAARFDSSTEEDGKEEDAGQQEGNEEEETATAGGDVDTEGSADI
jgi:hypothetical protein